MRPFDVRSLSLILSLVASAAAGVPQPPPAPSIPPAVARMRPANAFESMASRTSLKTDQTEWRSEDTVFSGSWRAQLDLSPPFTVRLALVRKVTVSEGPSYACPLATEIVLEDKDGVARTLLTFQQEESQAQKPMPWVSWVAFGRSLDLLDRFDEKGGLTLSSFKLDTTEQALLGVGPQRRDATFSASPDLAPAFLPYKGLERSRACLGYFLALGLVDDSSILLTRKPAAEIGYQVADVWTTSWFGLQADRDAVNAALMKRAKVEPIQMTAKTPETGQLTLGGFLAAHHIPGEGVSQVSPEFERRPELAQDAVLALSLSEDLTYMDRVYAGEHGNGKRFTLSTLTIPGFPCWVLVSQYDNETYPRMAFFVHDLVGLTRDGKTVSWLQLPQAKGKASNGPALLYSLAHAGNEGWKKPVFETSLQKSSTSLDEVHGAAHPVTVQTWLRAAVNAVRE